jgi:hypothetical protein
VVVVDLNTLQVVQTLDCQSATIVRVKWHVSACKTSQCTHSLDVLLTPFFLSRARYLLGPLQLIHSCGRYPNLGNGSSIYIRTPDNVYHKPNVPYALKLAAADAEGRILGWNVNEGRASFILRGSGKQIVDLAWRPGEDHHGVLAAITVPGVLTLWNTTDGNKVRFFWLQTYPKKEKGPERLSVLTLTKTSHLLSLEIQIWSNDFQTDLRSFSFDPFDLNSGCLLSNSGSIFVVTGNFLPLSSSLCLSH